MRFALLSGRSGEQLLAVVVHHIAWDGGSAEILVTDLVALYEQAVSGVPHQLPRIVASFVGVDVLLRRASRIGGAERAPGE